MQGGFDAWFYQGLAGICADPDRPGFKHAILRPQVAQGLDRVRAEYDSIHGKIVSEWRREGDRFHWRVVVPANTSARVHLPCDGMRTVTESGRPLDQAPGVSRTSEQPGFAILEIGSGEYAFISRLGPR